MRAQITLTPTESKKLIAKAIANLDSVKRASEVGLLVIHPSSSTFFIVEELTGKRPKTSVWVSGVIVPKGACLSGAASRLNISRAQTGGPKPDEYTHSWVIQGGELTLGISLRELFEKMGTEDIYIKGVNTLDPKGTVGILIGSHVERGTIGRVISASRRKGFKLIFPVGLEKLIPVNIEDAAKEAIKTKYYYSMGVNCGLLPCKEGMVVTETKAVEILCGAKAIPIAAGGLDGAEGAITMVIKGEKEQVTRAISYAEECKGARLPRVNSPNCDDCNSVICDFPVRNKPWIRR